MSLRRQPDSLSMKIFGRLFGILVISLALFQASTAIADTKLPSITDPNATGPAAVAINPQTNKVYVANRSSNNITVVDGETNTFINITAPNATGPIAVAVNSATNQIYVSNTTSKNITVIDGETNGATTVMDTAVEGGGLSPGVPAPDSIAVNQQTSKIYVANTTDDSVTVIEGATNATTNIPVGASPLALVVNPKTDQVYVANFDSSSVSVIDGPTNQVVKTINVGAGPQGLALNHITNKIYVGNVNGNSISVIDGDTDTVKSTINLAAYYSSLSVYPTALAINYVTNKVYVGNDGNNTVTVINGNTDQISKSLSISTGFPVMLDVNAELNKIYVTGTSQNIVTLIDGQNDTFTPISDIGTTPVALAVNPISHRVYVANKQSSTVGVIDGAPPPDNQGPILTVTSDHLDFEAIENEGNPPAQNFNIGKTGQGTLQWTASVNSDAQSWLSVNKTSGSNADSVAVSINNSGLETGKHVGYVTIQNQTTPDSDRVVTVVLTVLAPPKLFVNTDEFTFFSIAGAPIKITTNPISIYNLNGPGGADLNWNANVSGNAPWLSVDRSSGVVRDEPDEIRLTIDSESLAAGNQQGKVTINSNGGTETIEMNGTVEPAPDFCSGDTLELNKSTYVRLAIEKVSITRTDDGGCDVKGELHIRAPHNDLRVSNVSGHVNGANYFEAQLTKPIEFRRGSVYVKLEAPQIYFAELGQYILVSNKFTWKLSALGTNVERTYTTLAAITGWGMQFEDDSFDFPDLKLDSFEVTNVTAEPRSWTNGAAPDPGLKITGQVRIKIPQNDVKANTTLYVRSDRIYGVVTNFSFKNFAGLSVTAEKVEFDTLRSGGYGVYITKAKLIIPGEWVDAKSGSASAFISMAIYKNDAYILEGGFELPDIKAGDFRLFSLKAHLIQEPGGYEIRAAGGIAFPSGKTEGECFIYVDVTLFNSTSGQSVLQFESPTDPNISNTISTDELSDSTLTQADLTASGLSLREITVDVAICPPYIAIGTTGFFITRVSGTVTLSSGIDRVRVKLWIESGDKKGGFALVSAEAQVTLRPRPFLLDMDTVVKTLGIQTDQTRVTIDQRSFGTTLEYDYEFLHADLTVNAGLLSSGFYVSGSGSATVGVKRANIYDGGCEEVYRFWVGDWQTWCDHFPPHDVNLPAKGGTEFGLFKNDSYGVKGFVEFWNYENGFFFNASNGSLSFGNVREYQLVKPTAVQAAHQSWQAVQNGTLSANQANLDERFTFPSDNEVVINTPITPISPIQALDNTQPIDVSLRNDVIFMAGKFPESSLQFNLVTPSGTEITPTVLPANVAYEEVVDADGTLVQMIYTVKEAEIGTWQAKIIGDTTNYPFQLAVLGNEPAHLLDNLTLTPTGNPNRFDVGWTLQSVKPDTRINIYASDGPIETSLDGSTVPLFTGVPLELDLVSNLTGNPQQQTIDLGRLPSGNYWIWVEADDGEAPPVRRYIYQGNEAAKININHMASFESMWTTDITATPDVNAAQMQIEWDVSAVHPDVDSYTLRLRSPDPFAPDTELLREIELGNIAEGNKVSTFVGNIEPGRAYNISIGAEDIDTQRISWSQEELVVTAPPDFSITAPALTIDLKAGQQTQIPLEITKSNIPGSVILSVVNDSLPDGLTLTFGNDPISATTASQITADIIARDSVIEGSYLVPIIGEGANIERFLDLTVNVENDNDNGNGNEQNVYLPLIVK